MKASLRIGAYLLVATSMGCAKAQAQEFFVRPGAYDYLGCPQIASNIRKAAAREQELKILIESASADAFGKFIAVQSYQTDYLKAQGEQKLLAEQAAKKNCAADLAAAPSKKFKSAKSGKAAKASKAAKPPKAGKAAKPAVPAEPATPN